MMTNRDEMVEQLVRMAQDAIAIGALDTARVTIKWIGVYGLEAKELQS